VYLLAFLGLGLNPETTTVLSGLMTGAFCWSPLSCCSQVGPGKADSARLLYAALVAFVSLYYGSQLRKFMVLQFILR
jgi:hypothetical protein